MLPVDCKICFSSKPAVQKLEYSFNMVFKATLFWTIKLMHALQKNLKAKQNVNRKIKITLNLAIMVAYFFLVYLCFKFLSPLSPFCLSLTQKHRHTDTQTHTLRHLRLAFKWARACQGRLSDGPVPVRGDRRMAVLQGILTPAVCPHGRESDVFRARGHARSALSRGTRRGKEQPASSRACAAPAEGARLLLHHRSETRDAHRRLPPTLLFRFRNTRMKVKPGCTDR